MSWAGLVGQSERLIFPGMLESWLTRLTCMVVMYSQTSVKLIFAAINKLMCQDLSKPSYPVASLAICNQPYNLIFLFNLFKGWPCTGNKIERGQDAPVNY